MALVRELEENGCKIRASKLCKYINNEVQRCVNCEYKQYTHQQLERLVGEYYLEQGLLEEYPIQLADSPGECALCVGQKNKATTQEFCEITNEAMDVKRDVVGAAQKENGGDLLIEADCCEQCAKNIKKARFMNTMWATIAVTGVVILNALVALLLLKTASYANIAVLAAFSAAGYAFYYFMAKSSYEKISQKTYLHMLDIPKLKDLAQKGFYVSGKYKFLPGFMDKRQIKQTGKIAKNSR